MGFSENRVAHSSPFHPLLQNKMAILGHFRDPMLGETTIPAEIPCGMEA